MAQLIKYLLTWIICLVSALTVGAQITLSPRASSVEQYAASELQRYYYQLSGRLLEIEMGTVPTAKTEFMLTSMDNPLLVDWMKKGKLTIKKTLKEQGYAIKSVKNGNQMLITIVGTDACGLLYGVYGLLEDHLGMRFYMSGDVFPEKKITGKLPRIDDERAPKMAIRGFLPWTNFPQSATIYSWSDWRYIIDQAAKMRMNFIMLHNYNAGCGHNEMFHNFEYNDYLSRGWMPTVKTGHGWACPGWDVNEYRFGASAIYDDYDFGADYGLHNETLTNRQIKEKGATIFRQVISYAHQRGVKIGLGLDIDLILPEYQAVADERGVITAQTAALSKEYPELDYLLCFQSENPKKDSLFYAKWNTIFKGFYEDMKQFSPATRIAVSGWGMTPESVAELPKDVICAPISYYSATFEPGKIYGDREYWGCPWLERDFNSSQYYYPYNVNLSETIRSFEQSSPNMSGFYALTWRLTDAVSPKMWYISKAPWYDSLQLNSSEKVYSDFAKASYGAATQKAITTIINQNEPFATDFAECQETPGFNQNVNGYPLFNIRSLTLEGKKKKDIKSIDYVEKNGTEHAPCDEGGECVGYIMDGNWLKYDSIDFDKNTDRISIRVASASSGGIASISIDELNGPVIAKIEVKNTEGWQAWKTVNAPIRGVCGVHSIYVKFAPFDEIAKAKELAEKQLAVIDSCLKITPDASYQRRLSHLRARIQAVDCHVELNARFGSYQWSDLPGRMEEWAYSFLHRIDDVSSMGNIMSTQNRFVQQNYIAKVNKLRKLQQVKAPSHLIAKGTCKGAVISWLNEDPATKNFVIYRNGIEIATVSASVTNYHDQYDGLASYTVLVIDTDGQRSPKGIPSTCQAGSSDQIAPVIVFTSPATSLMAGQGLSIKISLIDNRDEKELSGTLFYRTLGEKQWKQKSFRRRVRAVFVADIPDSEISSAGLEYYIQASDSDHCTLYPASAPQVTQTVVVTLPMGAKPATPTVILEDNNRLCWNKVFSANRYYIYRGTTNDFDMDTASRLTFVGGETTSFRDNGYAFDGSALEGVYYYRVTALDCYGNESKASLAIKINMKSPK